MMERLFEKVLQEIKKGISFPLAILVTVIVFFVNPNNIIQYSQNKIIAFTLIFFFFYTVFLIVYRTCSWIQKLINVVKLKVDEEDKMDRKIAIKIRDSHPRIREEFFNCYSKGKDKIPRTDELDHLVFCLGLRNFFEPNKHYYIVNQNVLRAIKKYHRIAFEDLYWDKNYEN